MNNEKKTKKPNWISIIFTVFLVLMFVVIIYWLIRERINNNASSEVDLSVFKEHLKKSLDGNTQDHVDNIYLKDINIDYFHGRITYTFVDNNHVGTYYINLTPELAKEFAGNSNPNTSVAGEFADIAQGRTLSQLLHEVARFNNNGNVEVAKILDAGIPVEKPQFLKNLIFGFGPTLLYILLMILLYVWIMKRQKNFMGQFGDDSNPSKKIKSDKTFKDVAGNKEAIEEIQELVDYLKDPSKYANAGARMPHGVLLGGPPGTGKTLLAKATAGEANVPFYFISASGFVEMFVGLGAKRVRSVFDEARKNAPAIIFIDELDAIGRTRGAGLGGGHDEREQTLNQLLVEMDGMKENNGILLFAATNRTDVLDPALTRPGRFDRIITVGLPDVKERQEILELHARGKRLEPSVNLAQVAKRTPGFSGAQLANVINEASLLAVRARHDLITRDDIDEGIDRTMSGPAKKNRVISKEELTMVAYHEAGHAVVGIKTPGANKVQKITIIPRGSAGGYNLMTPETEKYNMSKQELIAVITSFMGGRAAEEIIYGADNISTGASDDISKATKLARKMVSEWGMSELGPIQYEQDEGSPFLGRDYLKSSNISGNMAHEIDLQVRKIITEAKDRAMKTIRENMQLLELIKTALLNKETIVSEEIEYIAQNLQLPPETERQNSENVNLTFDDIIKND
ncbi:ATP-dependent zinc metalloprotease FtsH [Mycoplasmopsis opalescens]|uniref:ATP-dependent zinc metalloprotease FtsH n=1 Tax=Mycoplasmopsis opalescens TaxID=114886 RepID=UPI0004A71B3C|nr:ATP-dependent zinc metalloprotease FtsH [Mycoplasmopsis opalescens]